MAYAAVHLPGGNLFDDVRIDIAASFVEQEAWLPTVAKRSVRRSRLYNHRALAIYAATRRLGLHAAAVDLGLSRGWFDEFREYWENVLGGRPLELSDFHQLRFHYRMKAQYMHEFSWSSPAEHVANWQAPENLSATFQFVYRYALHPGRSRLLPRLLDQGDRVLEFGCSLAPMYRGWRAFFSHVDTRWTLADLPTFPFHYARHAYGADAEAQFALIGPDRLDDPLHGFDEPFDVIIVQEVFEHLHRPRAIAEYLLDRLRPGGRLFFDYVRGEPVGHNTPAGLQERLTTLQFLADRLDITHGEFRVAEKSLGSCIGRKR